MPLNPNNETDRARLGAQVSHHYRILDPFRTDRVKMIRDYCGSQFGDEAEPKKRRILINLMLQTAEAYCLAMAANCPQFHIYPRRDRKLAGFALHTQQALNNLVYEIRLEETLQALILDAFFGPGFLKICLGSSAQVEIEQDVWMDPGRPYVGRVSLDDWVHDTAAKDFRQCEFYADRYRMPFENLDDSAYDQKVVKTLSPTSKYDTGSGDRAQDISHGRKVDPDESQPMIDLADVYRRDWGKVCTWPVEGNMVLKNVPPLAVIDWDGPETGPYDMLNLGPVPDNIMPVSPSQNLKHLFDLINSCFRKLDISAKNMKEVLTVMAGQEDDARKLIDAKHMDVVSVKSPKEMQVHTFNGPNAVLQAFSMVAMQIFDRQAGNLKARSGLGQQADTLGQEQMIQSEIQQSEGALALKVLKVTQRVGKALHGLMFDDAAMTIESAITVPGLEKMGPVRSDWTPEYRAGRKSDYDLDVQPYSMAYQSPSTRARRLRQHANEMMPYVQAGLVEFDVGKFNEALGRYDDMYEYSDIWTTPATPIMQQSQSGEGAMPLNPNKPNGKYTRTSVSNGPQGDGQMAVLSQMMQSAGNAQGAA